jgi:hypothetical protein
VPLAGSRFANASHTKYVTFVPTATIAATMWISFSQV